MISSPKKGYLRHAGKAEEFARVSVFLLGIPLGLLFGDIPMMI